MTNLERLAEIDGRTPISVCKELARLAGQVFADEAIVEIGVFRGRSLCYLAYGAKFGNAPFVYGVDAFNLPGSRGRHAIASNDAEQAVRDHGLSEQVKIIKEFSVIAASKWEGRKIGLLYIDSDHSYNGVRRDVEAWLPHTNGGIIAFDDYDKSTVKSAVEDLVQAGMLHKLYTVEDRLVVTQPV